ncbi:transposase [Cupriavidus basilensis]
MDRGNRTTRQRRQFDASFKLEVVRMVKNQGLSVGDVCRTMELERRQCGDGWRSTIRNWRAVQEWCKAANGRAAAHSAVGG